MIVGIRYALMGVMDVDSSRALFEVVLGRSVSFQDGSRWAEFKFDSGSRLAVASLDEAGVAEPGMIAVFESDDFDHDLERLRAAGLHPIAIRDMGSHGRTASFGSERGTFQIFARGKAPPASP